MRTTVWICGLLLGCASTPAPKPAEPPDEALATPAGGGDLTAEMLRRLHAAAGCPAAPAPRLVFCAAADGWAGGTRGEIGAGSHALVGVTIALVADQPVEKSLERAVSVSALALRSDAKGTFALVTDIPPKGEKEKKMLADAQAGLAEVAAGRAARVPVAAPLRQYLDTLPAGASHAVSPAASGWRFEGEAQAELRRVGNLWVVVEAPAEGPAGRYVSIFADVARE